MVNLHSECLEYWGEILDMSCHSFSRKVVYFQYNKTDLDYKPLQLKGTTFHLWTVRCLHIECTELEFIQLNSIAVLLDLRHLYARTVASENYRFGPFDKEIQ
jgi:hypothetical protein